MSAARSTTNHHTIKTWAEERQGKPAIVAGTESNDSGLLRINFPGYAEKGLKEITWEQFFKIFDENELEFLYQDEIEGGDSRFFKFVERTPARTL